VSLDQARKERDRIRDDAEASRGAIVAPVHKPDRTKTVKVVAEEWLSNGIANGRWKSLTYLEQVRQRLRDHVYPVIGHQPIATLGREMMRQVLDQADCKDKRTMWVRTPTVADQVRRVVADIINFATQMKYRREDLPNPAAWDQLQYLYPSTTTIHTTTHHAAVEPEDASHLMARIRELDGIPARALQFILLAAVRLAEVFGGGRENSEPLLWRHIDGRNWRVPQTKKSKPLVVPLSDQALAVLAEMKLMQCEPKPEDRVVRCSKSVLRLVLVEIGMSGKQTVHGCRALFDTWARNIDDDREPLKGNLIDAALCHKFESETQEAYNRGSFLEKRRALMQRWADYLDDDSAARRHNLRIVRH